jgi:peroxin-6
MNCRFTLSPNLSLRRIASRLPFTYTGADFYALCSDAMLKAVTRQASLVDSKIAAINSQNLTSGKPKISTAYFFDHFATKEDIAVLVEEEDFINAERELVPSVSAKELDHYKRVRAQFEKAGENEGQTKGKGSELRNDGIPLWQQESGSPKGRRKGKGKAVERNGKGKARALSDEDGDDDDDDHDEFYTQGGVANGRDKGKGKAVAMGFQQGSVDDEEDLYG